MTAAAQPVQQQRTSGPAVEVRGLSHTFSSQGLHTEVLRNLDMQVARGSFVTVVGPSGCGKSTLLNFLIGVERPTAGTVLHEGQVVKSTQTTMGLVPQDDRLLPWLTTFENVALPLKIRHWEAARIRPAVVEVLRKVRLEGFDSHYPHQLSGGMRKRLAIARTLVYESGVLLMDEPFGNIDAQTRLELQQELLDLWEQTRPTVIFITHDLSEAIALSDEIFVLSRRPSNCIARIPVPIARPRDPSRIQLADGFKECYAQLWTAMQRGMTAHE